MIEEIKALKKEIDKSQKNSQIDQEVFEKRIYELLKVCLKNKQFKVKVGNYGINVNPKEMEVTYESLSTFLQISNKDIYEEYDITDNCFYYIIKNEDNQYDDKSPVLKVNNTITKSSPNACENLYIELLNGEDLNIKDYLKNEKEVSIENSHYAMVTKEFKPSDERLNEQNYLNLNKVMLVDKQKNGGYKPTYRQDKLPYVEIEPNLDINKEIISTIYKALLKFYQSYI